jgi:hypothetical protein
MNHDGRLVKLENGGWAQFKRVPVAGIAGLTVLVAVELEPNAQARLNANGAPVEGER